jgi:hypothetical protein
VRRPGNPKGGTTQRALGTQTPAPAPARAPAPPAADPTRRSVVVLSDEARHYLRPRTAADLDAETEAAKKRRGKTLAEVERVGGFVAATEAIAGGTDTRIVAYDLGNLLLTRPEEERARCLAIAERAWPNAPFQLRCKLLDCFPRRADWAAAIARDFLALGAPGDLRELLLPSLEEPDLVLGIHRKNAGPVGALANFVVNVGERSVPVLDALLDRAEYPNEEKAVARALACVGTPEAAGTFAKYLRRKNVRPYATEFFSRFPHLADGALAELGDKKTQVGRLASDILTSVRRASATARVESSEQAPADEVPTILRVPPWELTGRPRKRLVVRDALEIPNEPLRLHWSERARRRYIARHFEELGRELPAAEIAKDVDDALAIHGEARLAEAADHLANAKGDRISFEVESPRIAARIARRALLDVDPTSGRDPLQCGRVLAYLERYPEASALGLMPFAVGAEGRERESAERGLRHLARRGHRELVRETARNYGGAVRDSVDEILAWDVRFDGPKKPPKMPGGYRVGELRAPRTKSGKVLPTSAVENLDRLLAATDPTLPLAGEDEIRAACDPRSLAEHAWDLARAWDIDGGKRSCRWMLHAVAHVGDDEVVRRLTPALKGEGIANMLGVIDTDAALAELVTILVRIRDVAKPRKYAAGARRAFSLIAARRGLEVDVLEDQFVPTCDVGADGSIALDLGTQRIRVTFDPRLSTVLVDQHGERVKSLPRTGVDPDRLAAVTTTLKDLEEDVSALAALRGPALERAMMDGRTWSRAAFDSVWIRHPLMVHMARGVVWERRARGVRCGTFRVTEDNSLADGHDRRVELEASDNVGVAHPARMSKEERGGWRSVFTDYLLIQPFDQLAREPPELSEAVLAKPALTAPCAADAITLQARIGDAGWVLYDDGSLYRARIARQGGGALVIPFEDGTFGLIDLARGRACAMRNGVEVRLDEVDDVVRCELARALHAAAT